MQGMTDELSDVNSKIGAKPSRRNWLSFWGLLTLQTQNAFNDKAAQFLLIPVGAWLVLTGASVPGADKIEYILASVIVLPFILFSPFAGWLSDRFSKTSVVRAASILQLLVLVWVSVCIYYQQLWLAVLGFFMLSVQSVILSPAKKGLVKELVGHEKLGFASGLLEITVILAICAGQIITGFWFTARLGKTENGWEAALTPLLILTVASLVALCMSLLIQKTPAQGQRKFKLSILTEHFGQLRELLSERPLRLSAFGVAFFWGYAGFLNLAAIAIPKYLTGGGGNFALDSAVLMSAASLGIITGGAMASFICRKKIELGLVPLGGFVMVVGSLALALTPLDSVWLRLWLFVAGVGGALFLVPLNANIQDLCPPEKRGRILAGLGLLDCLFGLVAVLLQLGLMVMKVSFAYQFIGLSLICIFATQYSARLLPQHLLSFLVLSLFKVFYGVRGMNAERIPPEGGVLLTSNHVSYMDAFILSAASPRKIRFLIFDGYFKHPLIGQFVRFFDTVPISKTRAKEALEVAAEALEQGHLVCIFPEGQLTRSGGMNEFKRGFEMIAKKASCPVLPTAMDGLWGSIFSFERGRFIYKIPYTIRYGLTVNFGKLIPPEQLKAGSVRAAVSALRVEAFAARKVLENPLSILDREVMLLSAKPAIMDNYQQSVIGLRNEDLKLQKQLVANALQMGDVNAIIRGDTVMVEWTALESCRDIIAITFAQYYNLKLILVDSSISKDELLQLSHQYEVDKYIGGNALAAVCVEAGNELSCYNVSPDAVAEKGTLPCLLHEGRVISMSMPHPVAETATKQHQDGYRKGTWGRLLPGFQVKSEDGCVRISGVSINEDKDLKIDAKGVDLDGFIVQL